MHEPTDRPSLFRAGNDVITAAIRHGFEDGKQAGRDEMAREHHQWLLSHDEQLAQVAAEARREALLDAAEAWESSARDDLRDLAEKHYEAGGPSMPTIWLRLRAESSGVPA